MNFLNTHVVLNNGKFVFLVLVLVQLESSSSLRPPLTGPVEVNINVPHVVGGLLGTILNSHKKRSEFVPGNLQASFGPVSVNVDFPHQPHQYTPENYQYVPPPPPFYQQEGYYPYGPTQSGYYGSGYYPVAPSPQYQHYPPYPGQSYLPQQPNPYMRPAYPNGRIMQMDEKSNMPPLTPIKEQRKASGLYGSIKKGSIITPDSPLYVHIPEVRPTLAIDPRR